jgi:hypothetical protein
MFFRVAPICAVLALGACSSGAGGSPASAQDAAPDSGGTGLAGTVKDQAGMPVANAKVSAGGASATSEPNGKYILPTLAAGTYTLEVTRDWFKPSSTSVTVGAALTIVDPTIEEIPLALDPADQALAAPYNKAFDWTRQASSVAVLAKPTRRDLDDALYFHNPALYRNTSGEPPLTPSPQPALSGTPMNFNFPIQTGRHLGQQVFEAASIVDSIADTPFGPEEPAVYALWTPLMAWLGEWDVGKSADLRAAGLAVRMQSWGGPSSQAIPQEIEKVYIDAVRGTIWVKVVFASFVQLGPGITDNDGDGLKEIYAKVGATHYTLELIGRLAMYGATVLGTHGLGDEVSKSLAELPGAQVESRIGQSVEVPGVGTFKYPFLVVRHPGGQRNVILAGP